MRDENKMWEAKALCPLDGRYANISERLSSYFSEYALVENRVEIEVEWLVFLLEHSNISDILEKYKASIEKLYEITSFFSEEDFTRIKEIEAVTNHDVKAVELFVAEKLDEFGMSELKSFVHIGCTSEDINNTAYATMVDQALHIEWIPAAERLIECVRLLAKYYADVPLPAHTHGQAATPTTVGKEFGVFAYRLTKSLDNIREIEICAKFNGATGNYSAISVAFPNEPWQELCREFVEEYLDLTFNPVTTQIESHDWLCHLADAIRHFNNVMLDLDVDMWLYISKGYFKQIAVKNEVGSSTMPHKVNPIRFENSEANVDMSNAIFMALSNKLARSRMQRDLSDSSAMRNVGVGFGYSLQAIQQTIGGLEKVEANQVKLAEELENRWEVLAEPIQTILRKYGIPDAYDRLKELTRGKEISKEVIHEFIKSLDILLEEDRNILLTLTPASYVGLAPQIVKELF